MWVEKGEGPESPPEGSLTVSHKGFLFRSWERLVTSDWFLAELHPIRRKHGEGHLPKWE